MKNKDQECLLEGLHHGEEVSFKTYSTYHSKHGPSVGTFYLTNFRIRFTRHQDAPYPLHESSDTCIELGKIFKISKVITKPDNLLEIWCKDFQLARFSFASESHACEKAYKVLHKLTFLPSIDKSFAFLYRPPVNEDELEEEFLGGRFDGWKAYDAVKEYARMGIPDVHWRISTVNQFYKLCASYPHTLVVPSKVDDTQLKEAAHFRMRERIPVLSWRHFGSGAALSRSSQPRVGWGGGRSSADEELIAKIRSANPKQPHLPLIVVDARSRIDVVANKAMGAGSESHHYENTEVNFLGIGNAPRVAEAGSRLFQLVHSEDRATTNDWFAHLSNTRWLEYISLLIASAVRISRSLEKGHSIHVHCSDGWDRTVQLVSLAMLLSDPYYRTIDGFAVLVEKEWLSFGHKFEDRVGHASIDYESKERSPIFVQWVDCVYQLIVQFPTVFEFNEHFIITLLDAVFSLQFGTFLGDSERSRVTNLLSDRTVSFWSEVHDNKHSYTNAYYNDYPGLLAPCSELRYLQFWTGFYLRWSMSSTQHVELGASDAKILKTVQDKQVLQQTLSHSNSVNEELKQQIFSLANDKAKMNGEVNALWQKIDSLLELLQCNGDSKLLLLAQTLMERNSTNSVESPFHCIAQSDRGHRPSEERSVSDSKLDITSSGGILRSYLHKKESSNSDSNLATLVKKDDAPHNAYDLKNTPKKTSNSNLAATNKNSDSKHPKNAKNSSLKNDSDTDLESGYTRSNSDMDSTANPRRRHKLADSLESDGKKLSRSKSETTNSYHDPNDPKRNATPNLGPSPSNVLIPNNLLSPSTYYTSDLLETDEKKRKIDVTNSYDPKRNATPNSIPSPDNFPGPSPSNGLFIGISPRNSNSSLIPSNSPSPSTSHYISSSPHNSSQGSSPYKAGNSSRSRLKAGTNSTNSSDDKGNDELENCRNRLPHHHGARRWRQMLEEKNNLLEENNKLKETNKELTRQLQALEKTLENERDRSRRLAASKKSLISNLTNISESPPLNIMCIDSSEELKIEMKDLSSPYEQPDDYLGDSCILGGTGVRLFSNYTTVDRERCEIDLNSTVSIPDRWCAGCDVVLKGHFVMVRVAGKTLPHCKDCANSLVSLNQQTGTCNSCSKSLDSSTTLLAPSDLRCTCSLSGSQKFKDKVKIINF